MTLLLVAQPLTYIQLETKPIVLAEARKIGDSLTGVNVGSITPHAKVYYRSYKGNDTTGVNALECKEIYLTNQTVETMI